MPPGPYVHHSQAGYSLLAVSRTMEDNQTHSAKFLITIEWGTQKVSRQRRRTLGVLIH